MPKFDLIQCTVRLNIDNSHTSTEIVKAGPSALTAPEVLLLDMMHSLGGHAEACAIQGAIKVGEVETTKDRIIADLRQRYGEKADNAFPRGRHVPVTLADLELPEGCLGAPRKLAEPEMTADEKRDALTALGVDLPDADLSESDLDALLAEAQAA